MPVRQEKIELNDIGHCARSLPIKSIQATPLDPIWIRSTNESIYQKAYPEDTNGRFRGGWGLRSNGVHLVAGQPFWLHLFG